MSHAVVLLGHGAPAKDCPPYLVFKLRQLKSRRASLGGEPGDDERELEEQVRSFPRTSDNDPYKHGLEAIAQRLGALLGGERVTVAFGEFCNPTLEQAVAELVAAGATRITIAPSMMTPGGLHSEEEFPKTVEELRGRFAGVELVYAWPFELDAVARLIAAEIRARSVRPAEGDRDAGELHRGSDFG
jgi:sirohydrochlorin cobaltochelatase